MSLLIENITDRTKAKHFARIANDALSEGLYFVLNKGGKTYEVNNFAVGSKGLICFTAVGWIEMEDGDSLFTVKNKPQQKGRGH